MIEPGERIMLKEEEKKRVMALWHYGNTFTAIAEDTLDRRSSLTYSEILKEVIEYVKEEEIHVNE